MLSILVLMVCFGSAVASSIGSARLAKMGPTGYGLAIITGLVIGFCYAFAMWKSANIVVTRVPRLRSEALQRWCLRVFYFSAIFWIFLSMITATWITDALMRLVA